MSFPAILSTGLGVAGLFGASSQAKAQAKYTKAAADALKLKTKAQKVALGIAENYDPAAESQKAVDYAGNVASDRLGKSLADVNARFRNAGGSPAGDSLFRVQAQGATNRVADPLRQFAAQQAAQSTQLRLSALGQALGTGGDIAAGYSELAGQSAPSYSGAIQAFTNGLTGLTQKKQASNPFQLIR